MTSVLLTALLAISQPTETAADAITLRDGRVLLGQLGESAPRGVIVLILRRTWAEEHVPDLAETWQVAESPARSRARSQRRQRLDAWRADRARAADRLDPVLEWIDRERERLARPFDPAEAPLIRITLGRSLVKTVARRPEASRRMLRQAWISGIPVPEERAIDDLRAALKRAHVPAIGEDPAPIDELLPEAEESDNRWRLRRAATEVTFDAGPQYVRFQNLVVPEGQENALTSLPGALSGLLNDLLDDKPPRDPLGSRFREAEARAKVGAVVTRLELGAEVVVEATLWVRTARSGWQPALTRRAAVAPNAIPGDAGRTLADDPQVKAAFHTLEALGLGPIGDDARRLSLRAGSAAQQALGQAGRALEDEIQRWVLPVRSSTRPITECPADSPAPGGDKDSSRATGEPSPPG